MRAFAFIGLVLAVLPMSISSTRGASVDDFIDFSLTSGSSVLLPGRLHVPDNYDPSKSYPLITFFHGYGERGTNNLSQINGNINNLLAHTRSDAFLFAPQSSNGQWSESGTAVRVQMSRTVTVIEQALATYSIDADRVYATGLSAGGDGTWDAVSKFPEIFAAGVPISSGWIRGNYSTLLADKPIWAYHATNDGEIDVEQTRKTVNNILAASGHAKLTFPLNTPGNPYFNDGAPYYTDGATFFAYDHLRYSEFDGGGHGISSRAYNETALYDWLFAQSMVPEPTVGAILVLGMSILVGRRRFDLRPSLRR